MTKRQNYQKKLPLPMSKYVFMITKNNMFSLRVQKLKFNINDRGAISNISDSLDLTSAAMQVKNLMDTFAISTLDTAVRKKKRYR